MKNKLKIKVCGTRDPANIQALVGLPIDYIGFIFYAQSSRFVATQANCTIPLSIKKVGVFVNASLDEIKEKIEQYDLQVVQLHGDESPAFCKEVQALGIETFKAFGVDSDFEWESIKGYEEVVDYFLFDTKSNAYGGTGQTFNWDKLKENPYPKPYLLSGGISIENIQDAAQFEDDRLVGLDLNSKFETLPAVKNIDLLKQALAIIK